MLLTNGVGVAVTQVATPVFRTGNAVEAGSVPFGRIAVLRHIQEERRRYPRRPVACPVAHRPHAAGNNPEPFRRGFTVDISRQGLKMLCRTGFEPGTPLEVFFRARDGSLAVGSVVHVVRSVLSPAIVGNYSSIYNPEVMSEYEVSCQSPGSWLFADPRQLERL